MYNFKIFIRKVYEASFALAPTEVKEVPRFPTLHGVFYSDSRLFYFSSYLWRVMFSNSSPFQRGTFDSSIILCEYFMYISLFNLPSNSVR